MYNSRSNFSIGGPPLRLESFGIALRPLQERDLDMVLKWRNSNHIRKYARSQEIIDLDTHKQWFQSLAEKEDLYYIIEHQTRAIGLIWACNFQLHSCETGMYIYEQKLQNTLLSYKASLLFTHHIVNTMHLNTLTCSVLNNNPRALRFNLSLGYKIVQETEDLTTLKLLKDDFIQNYTKIYKLLSKSSKK